MSTSAFHIELTSRNKKFSHKPTGVWTCISCLSFFFWCSWNKRSISPYVYFLFSVLTRAEWNISDPKVTNIIPARATEQRSKLVSLSLCLNPVQELWRLQPPKNIAPSLSEATGKMFIFSRLLHLRTQTHRHTLVPLSLWGASCHYIRQLSTNTHFQPFLAPFFIPKSSWPCNKFHNQLIVKVTCKGKNDSLYPDSNCEDLPHSSVLYLCILYIFVFWTVG